MKKIEPFFNFFLIIYFQSIVSSGYHKFSSEIIVFIFVGTILFQEQQDQLTFAAHFEGAANLVGVYFSNILEQKTRLSVSGHGRLT